MFYLLVSYSFDIFLFIVVLFLVFKFLIMSNLLVAYLFNIMYVMNVKFQICNLY